MEGRGKSLKENCGGKIFWKGVSPGNIKWGLFWISLNSFIEDSGAISTMIHLSFCPICWPISVNSPPKWIFTLDMPPFLSQFRWQVTKKMIPFLGKNFGLGQVRKRLNKWKMRIKVGLAIVYRNQHWENCGLFWMILNQFAPNWAHQTMSHWDLC